jgi:uridylate kinase
MDGAHPDQVGNGKDGHFMKYKRVLLKLSGKALAGDRDFGFTKEAIDHITDEVLSVRRLGVELAILVGGGNVFKGQTAAQWGIERAEADNIGMMATVINSLFLRGVLSAKGAGEVRVMTATPMNEIAEPYIRLRAVHHLANGFLVIFAGGIGQPFVTTDYPAVQRAIEVRAETVLMAKHGANGVYTANPQTDPQAAHYRTMTYDEAIGRNLAIMDQSAFILARDYKMPLHIFDFVESGSLKAICEGEAVGTYIASGVPVTFY